MGVGRNLAYRRSIFFENKGFGAYNNVISGDDDLFVNTNAKKNNTCVEFRKDTHTRSVPSSTFKEWIAQKKRHLTTAPYYKFRDKFLLILEPATRLIFYTGFIVLVASLFFWQYVLIIFGLRLISQVIILALNQKRLNEPGLVGYSLIFDIFSPMINRPRKNLWK
jgi:hypothetical protein